MYKCIKNQDKVYKSTGGQKVTVPRDTEYSIYWVKNSRKLHVLDVKDHFTDAKGVGEGICKMMNQDKIVLNLNV